MKADEKKFKHLKRSQYRAFKRALGLLAIGSTSMPEVIHDAIRDINEKKDVLEFAINRWYRS